MIYTKEMEDFYYFRTIRHIVLVHKYIDKLSKVIPELLDTKYYHDLSKFSEPEKTPYIFITWKYEQQRLGNTFEVPEYILSEMQKATFHHVKNNKHHPEFWDEKSSINSINRENRDSHPENPVSAVNMPSTYIAEMVADWAAMAEEKGNTVRSWADKNVNLRWIFTEQQTQFIYSLITYLEKSI